jgi:hypothetical protein
MKLTEAKLKQLIKEVIEEGEGAKGIADLPDGVCVSIVPVEDRIEIFFSNDQGEKIDHKTELSSPQGVVIIQDGFFGPDAPCNHGMVVYWALADQGWGPLLYDVAIEIATMLTEGNGLAADRGTVSSKAYKVWNYYLKNRSVPDCSDPATVEYFKGKDMPCPGGSAETTYVQLDDSPGYLTKDKTTDDCLQGSSLHHARKQNIDWPDTAIAKMYRKPPTTMKALGNRLIIKDMELSF